MSKKNTKQTLRNSLLRNAVEKIRKNAVSQVRSSKSNKR